MGQVLQLHNSVTNVLIITEQCLGEYLEKIRAETNAILQEY